MAKNDLMSAISGLSGEGEHEKSEKSESKSKEKDGGKKKPKVVNLGKAGSFSIKKPGDLRHKAERAGESTHEFAESHDKGNSKTARESRAALGLMAMHHGKK